MYITPATTRVAACMTALTDVGPSIASGSHECIPIATLLTDTISSSTQSIGPLHVLHYVHALSDGTLSVYTLYVPFAFHWYGYSI